MKRTGYPGPGTPRTVPLLSRRTGDGKFGGLLSGLLGQGFNFVALVVPVLICPEASLVRLILASSIATAAFTSAILAMPMRYPSIKSDGDAAIAMKAALLVLMSICAGLIAIGSVGCLLHARTSYFALMIAVGGLLFCQGLDNLLIAWMVRQDNARGIGHNRLRYGILNVILLPSASFALSWQWSLVGATCLTYILAAWWSGWTHRRMLLPTLRQVAQAELSAARHYIGTSVVPSISYLLNGAGSQAAGIVLGAIGIFAAPWAAGMRIAGGFSTVVLQLVAPSVDARIGRAVRERNHVEARRAVISGITLGIPTSVATCLLTMTFIVLSGKGRSLDSYEWILLAACLMAYWGSMLLILPVWKTITLLGADVSRLIWDVGRLVALGTVVTFLRGGALLVGISAVICLFNGLLLFLTVRAINHITRRGFETPPQTTVATSVVAAEYTL